MTRLFWNNFSLFRQTLLFPSATRDQRANKQHLHPILTPSDSRFPQETLLARLSAVRIKAELLSPKIPPIGEPCAPVEIGICRLNGLSNGFVILTHEGSVQPPSPPSLSFSLCLSASSAALIYPGWRRGSANCASCSNCSTNSSLGPPWNRSRLWYSNENSIAFWNCRGIFFLSFLFLFY